MPIDGSRHLHNGGKMARVGVAAGLFGIAIQTTGSLFGDAPAWRSSVVALPFWILAFFAGGALCSLFLPSWVRRRPGRATWARVVTGALASAATVLPLAVASAIASGDGYGGSSAAALLAAAAVIGAVIGAVVAWAAAAFGHHEADATSGAEAPPRLTEQR